MSQQNPNRPQQQPYQAPQAPQYQQAHQQPQYPQYQQNLASNAQQPYQQPPQGYQQPPQGYQQNPYQQDPRGYQQDPRGYQQPPVQEEPFDPNTFVMAAPAESQADFKSWPQDLEEALVSMEVVEIGRPVTKVWTQRNDKTGQMEDKPRTQVKLTLEVFKADNPDLIGQRVNVWYNPSLNRDAYMYALVKAIKHGQIEPDEPLALGILYHARVNGIVRLGPAKGGGQGQAPRRYPTITKEWMRFEGPFVADTPQTQFLSHLRGDIQTVEALPPRERSSAEENRAYEQTGNANNEVPF